MSIVLLQASLPESKYLEPDHIQFNYLSKELYTAITNNQDLAKKFTQKEIEILKEGMVPQSLTWHHHQE